MNCPKCDKELIFYSNEYRFVAVNCPAGCNLIKKSEALLASAEVVKLVEYSAEYQSRFVPGAIFTIRAGCPVSFERNSGFRAGGRVDLPVDVHAVFSYADGEFLVFRAAPGRFLTVRHQDEDFIKE